MLRRLPHNIEAEQALLGSIFVYGQKAMDEIDGLTPAHFAHADHRAIFERATELMAAGGTADPITLAPFFANGTLASGPGYLQELAASAVHPKSVAAYAATVKSDAERRELIEIGQRIVDDAYAGKNPAELIEVAKTAMRPLARAKEKNWLDAASIEPKNIDWLWKPRIIEGRINLIVGMGDVGKDTWCCRLVASITNGVKWPDGTPAPKPMTVGYIAPEDEADDTIVPRLLAAGADVRKVKIWARHSPPSPADVAGREVLVVSPLIALMEDGKNMNAEQDARSFLQLWQHGGQRTVIGTGHLSKKSDLSVVQRILGASGIVNFVRSTWLIQRDSEDTSVRLFQRLKNNLTPDDVGGLQFKIEHVGPWDQSIVTTVVGTTEKTADEVAQASIAGMGKQSAGAWLLNYLEENGGMVQASRAISAGKEAGYKEKAIQTAQQRSNGQIAATREGGVGKGGEWWWNLVAKHP